LNSPGVLQVNPMRIVHEINLPMQVGGGGKPYINTRGFQGYNGMRCDMVLRTDCPENHPDMNPSLFDDKEVIHIEGNVDHVIEAFELLVSSLKLMRDATKKNLGERRPTTCPDCPAFDDTGNNATHTEECEAQWNLK
jgi:hypothetical protein